MKDSRITLSLLRNTEEVSEEYEAKFDELYERIGRLPEEAAVQIGERIVSVSKALDRKYFAYCPPEFGEEHLWYSYLSRKKFGVPLREVGFERLERKLKLAEEVQAALGRYDSYVSGSTAVEMYLRDKCPDLYIAEAWRSSDVDIYVMGDTATSHILIGELLEEMWGGHNVALINPDEIYKELNERGKVDALFLLERGGIEVQVMVASVPLMVRLVSHDHPIVSVGLSKGGKLVHTEDFTKSIENRVLIDAFCDLNRKRKYMRRFPEFLLRAVEGSEWRPGEGQVEAEPLAVLNGADF